MIPSKTILALSLAASVGAHSAAIHTGLVNYWTLDGDGLDTAGSLAGNTSTQANDVVVAGTAGAATINSSGGLFGGAADFERSVANNGRLETSFSADTDFDGGEITMSAWVQYDDNSAGWQGILSSGEGNNYRMARRNNGNRLAAAAGGGDAQGVDGAPDINAGGWHHVAATTAFDGTNWNTILYVDGAQNGGTASNGVALANTGADFWIGSNPESTTRMWDGLIDDVAIFDRALTPVEIAQINTFGLAGTSLGGIPEPTSGLLLGLGGLMVAMRRRRR